MESDTMMTYEVRIIHKDGTCAVFGNIRACNVTYNEMIMYPADLTKEPIKIKKIPFQNIKSFKIAVKEF